MVRAGPGVPAVSSAPRLTFASSPCTSVYLVPEIVKFLKLRALVWTLVTHLVRVMTSPSVTNVWVQPLSPASETKYFWPPVSGPSPVNDQAPVLASVSVVPTEVSDTGRSRTPTPFTSENLKRLLAKNKHGVPAVSSAPRLTFASSP